MASSLLGLQSRLVGGIVVCALCGTGAVTAFALRDRDSREVLRLAASYMVAGMVVTLVGLELEWLPLAAAGTLVADIGFGASAVGAFATLGQIAGVDERGEVFAVAYVISYLAFSLPAVAAGLASTSVGLRTTALVYGLAIVALSVAARAGARPRRMAPACTAAGC